MAKLKQTEAPNFTSTAAAAAANHCVRKAEHDTAISGRAAAIHTHGYADITGLEGFILEVVGALVEDTASIAWTYTESGGPLTASVRLKESGGLAADAGGVYVAFGSGSSEAARGNHTHEEVHAPATASSTSSIDTEINGQEIRATIRLKDGGALDVDAGGMFVVLGSGEDEAAPGNHSHEGLNDPVTVQNSTSVSLVLDGQEITASVRLKEELGAGEGAIGVGSEGLFVAMGSSEGQAAQGNHTHALATQSAHGLMSAADKIKLDQYQELFQADYPVNFSRHDPIGSGEYVGGRYRWEQDMAVLRANVTASAPVGANVVLGLEVGGSLTGDTLTIPAGASNAEVLNAEEYTDLFIESGEYARWCCISGTLAIEDSASLIHLAMNVRPAIGTVPERKINCGGSEVAPFAVDQYYTGGGAGGPSPAAIDISGVTDPAPMAVYQTVRGRFYEAAWITYEIPGLARGIEYLVRLHFAELFWTEVGQQVFHISIDGATSGEFLAHDTLALTSGVKNKAVIREATLKADEDGMITITLKPQPNAFGGYFHSAINGIEVVRS